MNNSNSIFPTVLPILMMTLEGEEGYDSGDLLKCRELSPTCRRVYDGYLETRWNQLSSPSLFAPTKSILELGSAASFLDKIKTLPDHLNPILSRSLQIETSTIADAPFPTTSEVLNLLQKCGKHLYGLSLKIQLNPEDLKAPVNFLHQTLSLTPNLCFLQTEFFTNSEEESNGSSAADEAPLIVDKDTQDALINAFPSLPKLKSVTLLNSSPKLQLFTSSMPIRQYFGQLRKLRLNINLWKVAEYNARGMFPKLKTLHLDILPRKEVEEKIFNIVRHVHAPNLKDIKVTILEQQRQPEIEEREEEQGQGDNNNAQQQQRQNQDLINSTYFIEKAIECGMKQRREENFQNPQEVPEME